MKDRNIYERILKLASDKSISVRELERRTGLANAVIRQWKTSSPTVDNLRKVANYLDVSVDFLISGRVSIPLDKEERSLILKLRRAGVEMNAKNKQEIMETIRQIIEKAQEDNDKR